MPSGLAPRMQSDLYSPVVYNNRILLSLQHTHKAKPKDTVHSTEMFEASLMHSGLPVSFEVPNSSS